MQTTERADETNTREDAKRVADHDDRLQPTYPQIGRSVFLNPTTTRTGPRTVHEKSGRGSDGGERGVAVVPMRVSKRGLKGLRGKRMAGRHVG